MIKKISPIVLVFLLSNCASLTSNAPEPARYLGMITEIHTGEIAKSAAIFKETLELIDENYYDHSVSTEDLTRWAIEGMLERLDEHFDIDWSESQSPENHCSSEMMLGIYVARNAGNLQVWRVAPNSSAYWNDVRVGDSIVLLDDIRVDRYGAEEFASHVRCDNKKSFDITFLQEGILLTKTIRKRPVRFLDSFSIILPGNTGYIKIDGFHTPIDKSAVISSLKALLAQKPSRYIIDLRSMRGGLIPYGEEFLGYFLPSGTIIGRKGLLSPHNRAQFYTAIQNKIRIHEDTVVLVNRNTSSLGETMAVALQKLNRAVVIGERTRGLGTILSPHVLRTNSDIEILVPTALYFDPEGNTYNHSGVEPDIVVKESNPYAHYSPMVRDDILDAAIQYFEKKDETHHARH